MGRALNLSAKSLMFFILACGYAATSEALAITFTSDTTIDAVDHTRDANDIIVDGCTLTIDGVHDFSSLQIINGGILTHPKGVSDCDLTITNDLIIDSNSFINLDGKGHGSGSGLGGGSKAPARGGSTGGGGAGYGGKGGNGNVSGGGTYGSITEPLDLGSGGGRTYGGTLGGAGGGLIHLTVGGTLTVDGSLTSDGNNGNTSGSGTWRMSGGGGSGGSLYITAGTIAGSGVISANGGRAGHTDLGGGGGGGRIALLYDTMTFSGSLQANSEQGRQYGGAGTIYLKSSDETWGRLRLDDNNNPGLWTPLPAGDYTFDDIEVIQEGRLEISAGTTVAITSDNFSLHNDGNIRVYGRINHSENVFTLVEVLDGAELSIDNGGEIECIQLETSSGGVMNLKQGSQITCAHVSILQEGILSLDIHTTFESFNIASGGKLISSAGNTGFDLTITGDLTVEAGGSISADGKGHGSGGGLGGGSKAPARGGSTGGGGAGYGGKGGNGNVSGGGTYGSITEPLDLGSGGGRTYGGTLGGAGGGLIHLTVGGTLTVDGSLTSDGNNGNTSGSGTWRMSGGGGSGGSLYITAGTIAGSGVISANGGRAGHTDLGGGGGGGRIALYFDTYTFTGSISVDGGAGRQYGGQGTVYTIPEDSSLQLNRQEIGQITEHWGRDHWQFTGLAGQQVRLESINASSNDIVFDLWGPSGFIVFEGLQDDSELINLPESGSYTLIVRGTGSEGTRTYTFKLAETNEQEIQLDIPYTSTWVGHDQAQIFRLHLGDTSPLYLSLDDFTDDNVTELYVSYGYRPTRGSYDYRFDNLAAADQEILISVPYVGTWYILAYGNTINTPGDYTVLATSSPLFVTDVTPDYHGSAAETVITLTGAGFTGTTTVELVDPNDTRYTGDTTFESFERISATFPAESVPANDVPYDIVVTTPDGSDDPPTATLEDAFTVIDGGGAELELDLVLPSRIGYHNLATFYIEYKNAGDVAMPSPLITFEPRQNDEPGAILTLDRSLLSRGFWTSVMPQGFKTSIQFLASGETSGLLGPGESGRVPVYYAGWRKPWDYRYRPVYFGLGAIEVTDDTPLDWEARKDELKPDSMSADAWDAVWENLLADFGDTWGNYVQVLSDNARYLAHLGLDVTEISDLYSMEVAQANAQSIVNTLASVTDVSVAAPGLDITFTRTFGQTIDERYFEGDLGYGWQHNWNCWIEEPEPGRVVIHNFSCGLRTFEEDSRNTSRFFSVADNRAVLTRRQGRGFDLLDGDGTRRGFSADGKCDYHEDANGNRITLTYTGNQLTRLDHTGGQFLDITWTPDGEIESVTDPVGRTTTYSYDAGGKHLIVVGSFDRSVTTYAYTTGQGAASEHALSQITHPGGCSGSFEYDDRGRLQVTYRDCDARQLTYTYDGGRIEATDALGHTTTYYLNHFGSIAQTHDPLGNVTRNVYNPAARETRMIDPAGRSQIYTFDNAVDPVAITDALGDVTRFEYDGPFGEMTQLIDANGNVTGYVYDANGNLLSITYDDGSVESWTYDAYGNPDTWTNRRGQTIEYSFDIDGQLDDKQIPNEPLTDYVYDDRGNLIEATNEAGTITQSYYPAAHVHADKLQRITYPDGQWLEYTYNDSGKRASMLDHLGHRLDYHYDTAGRLERITNETPTEIVVYEYDDVGRLELKTLGNGVYTTYAYDAADRLLDLHNYAADDSTLSRFEYAYDTRGRRISMTTTYAFDDPRTTAGLAGTWNYIYDDLGQLIAWANPDGTEVVEYVYDALGNRITETRNSVVVEYTTNELNQYTQVGDTTYTYDLDGNLFEQTDPNGTTTYTFSAENKLVTISIPDNDLWESTYDAFGHRYLLEVYGEETLFVTDPFSLGNLVGEYSASTGELIQRYDYGAALLASSVSTDPNQFYTFDAIGSTSEWFRSDGATLKYTYEPFGNTQLFAAPGVLVPDLPEGNRFQFVGEYGVQFEVAGPGLHDMRARQYDANLGRFLSPDPLRLDGGDQNLYRYVRNMPIVMIDPSGLSACARWCDEVRDIFLGRCLFYLWRGDFKNFNKCMSDYGNWSVQCDTHCGTKGEPVFPPEEWIPGKFLPPWDPNKKTGPTGFGPERFVSLEETMPYEIEFENLEASGVAAQIVTISDPLSGDMDWSTFELTEIAFGDYVIDVPEGTQHFEWTEPVTIDGEDFEVQIEAGIHLATGEVYANFYSIDPETGLPPQTTEETIGFLPPNLRDDDGYAIDGRGQGHISYTIKARSDLPTGTEIRNIAYITFDGAMTIPTNAVDPLDPSKGTDPNSEALITIDADLPDSHIEPLNSESLSPVTLFITGEDVPGGSGMGSYDIYVSDNGGEFTLWQSTTEDSIAFTGEVDHIYAFYSIAKDNAGNYEEPPEIADTTTTIVQKHLLISSFDLIDTVRVGRTTHDHIYSVSLENTRDQDVSSVVMTVQPLETNVTLIDGQIAIGDIPNNSTVTSSDTITLRVDYADPAPTIKLTGQIAFDSTAEPGQVQDFVYLLTGANRDVGDITGDGRVGLDDLILLCDGWLSGNSLADIAPPPDGDGIVDMKDLAVMAENWLVTLDN